MAIVSIIKHLQHMKHFSNSNSLIPVSNIFHKTGNLKPLSSLNLIHPNFRLLHIGLSSLNLNSNQLDQVKNEAINQNLLRNNDSRPVWDDSITSADVSWIKESETDVLDTSQEDVSDISSFTSPSFNLAAYVNKSQTLQELVKMGVDLNKIENRKEAAECILQLDFEKDIKNYLIFLHDNGLPAEEFGNFITRNPFVFKQHLDDLQVRINYLSAKKFTPTAITRIITRNPLWLNFSTIEIDKRLGFFQRTFVLSGEEVRFLATKCPYLITYDLGKVSISLFAVKEDMGFKQEEIKDLLLKKPKLYTISTKNFISRFDYVHNVMEISHEQILQQPGILLFRKFIIEERHGFLKEIGKAQYNPKLPGYVSLETLVHGNDVDFCKNVAKTSIDVFNAYLKTR